MTSLAQIAERLNPLTEEQIKQYETDGYVIIRQGCSKDLIDVFNAHMRAIRAADPMPEWAIPKQRDVIDLSEKARFSLRLGHPHKHDGFSLQMMKLPIVRGALAQLLGDEAVGVLSMYFFKEPGALGQGAHQDYYYIRNNPNTLTAAWIAMEHTNEENGCLYVIPGSHKLGLIKHGKARNREEHEPWGEETEGVDLTKQVPVVLEPGDILFFHGLLIHSSTKNRSNRWRRSFVCHYVHQDSVVEGEHLALKTRLDS